VSEGFRADLSELYKALRPTFSADYAHELSQAYRAACPVTLPILATLGSAGAAVRSASSKVALLTSWPGAERSTGSAARRSNGSRAAAQSRASRGRPSRSRSQK